MLEPRSRFLFTPKSIPTSRSSPPSRYSNAFDDDSIGSGEKEVVTGVATSNSTAVGELVEKVISPVIGWPSAETARYYKR